MNRLSIYTLFIVVVLFSGCEQKQPGQEPTDVPPFKYWAWLSARTGEPDSIFQSKFRQLAKGGIDAVLINTDTDPGFLKRLTPLAKAEGLEVHAWIMAMNRPGDSIALQHPDWYAVSREGNSCWDTRPYVDYYQWMCPTRAGSRGHVLSLVEGLAKVEGIETVHLDYIRYSDIFLPIGLLPKYDLVQDEELPEFDFCYCEECIAEFEKTHHKNPLGMEQPELDLEWKQFRLNQVKRVVDDAYEIVHSHGKELSAAVFPYPEMAGKMVRQRWDKWNIDMVLPMIYHNFYNEELDWIGFATGQGVADLKGKNTSLHTGVFVPAIPPADMEGVIRSAQANGARGISFFDARALTDNHLNEILKTKRNTP